MESREQRCKELFDRWCQYHLADTELPELWELLSEADRQGKLEPMMQVAFDRLKEYPIFSVTEIQVMADTITKKQKATVRSFNVSRWAIAASIIFAVALGGYFFLYNKKDGHRPIVQISETNDVKPPSTNRGMITLANGRTISIDSITTGMLAQQSNVTLTKTADGKIIYSGNTSEVVYNTLTNPRGSKIIDMTLSDGSHVWLNAGSSVTYPIAFAGNERKVSITGEAYFEVTHSSTKPFKVSKGNMEIAVLGTHFNVNAYDDEAAIKVTLLEGSVKVNNFLIKPGQQAQVTDEIKVINTADLEQVMAWKNGNFKFSRTDLKIIMREIGRWYDVEVSYEGNIPVQLYNVGVPRTANVSEVLKGLEYTGAHFSVEGKKIIVRP